VADSAEELERRIGELRAAVRAAVLAGDRVRSQRLRAELREAELGWDEAVEALEVATLRDSVGGIAAPARSATKNVGGAASLTADPSGNGGRSGRRRGGGGTGSGTGSGSGGSGAGNGPRVDLAARNRPLIPVQRRMGRPPGPRLSIREQVHHALTLLSVPASPKLIIEVHTAFLGAGDIANARLTHQRRDEERSFRSSPYARPYYLCSALNLDRLGPVRGLLAVSTWPLERRIIGPLSPRVDFLTAAIQITRQVDRLPARRGGLSPAVARILWRFASNIPGAADSFDTLHPAAVADAARAELVVHEGVDLDHRAAGAARAREQLGDAELLFGARPR
jgi:hypothetical protein